MQKLRNNKLEINYNESIKNPEKYIKEVIEPFSHLIKKKELKIFYQNEMVDNNIELVADWKLY